MSETTNEQLLRELSGSFPANEGLRARIIDSFPYPVVIFTPNHMLAAMNDAFQKAIGVPPGSPDPKSVHILQYKIKDSRMAEAVKQVFKGNSFSFDEVEEVFSMFSGVPHQEKPERDRFGTIVIFPIPEGDRKAAYGVIVFMP
ncbi:MAG: hypothetical protein QM289_04960 [Bacillota bacterium]|jgi:hypothetical protein|nr:hypothetical protein [Eubacteriales bacterium]MDI9493815.1 hypothetical protein [Bacillota bacterium]NLV69643.1 hypothetical protein [Clostridiales bacterium]MDD3863737.1 hypothetical protein [Eubacteriales bacterium]MDD4445607.1 hypothetical protein [Eubacteriales bacterium]